MEPVSCISETEERVSYCIIVTGDVGSLDDELVCDGEPGESAQE